jgi:lysophospholipase L1-like esterase
VRGIFKRTYYRTNRIGLRGPNYAPSPRQGIYRIAIGGDSFTAGSGVFEEDAYPAVLEGLLNHATGGPRVEVINAGRGGLSAEWVVSRLERVSQTHRFHLVVYGWTINDIDGPAYQRLPKGRAWVDEPRRFERSSSRLLRLVWPRAVWVVQRFSPPRGLDGELRFNNLENPEAWAYFLEQLDRLSRLASERGICGHVFLHTHLSKLDGRHAANDIYERVAEAARAAGLSVTESFSYHKDRVDSDLWVGGYDPHPNIEGHRILAEALHQGLLRDLPPACWDVDLTGWPELSPRATRARAREARRASGD